MTIFQWLSSVTLAAMSFAALQAEPHCPGNIASLRPGRVQSQMIVPVSINNSGPYDFLLDTGTQITIVDPSIAEELHLKSQGAAEVVGVGSHTHATMAQLDIIEVGSKTMADPVVVVQDLGGFRGTALHIRGILGGNFLEHFDVLIDNGHSMLCLDDTKMMQPGVKGEHIALVTPPQEADGKRLFAPLIIAVHLSGAGARQLLMTLDSGTNVPFLFNTHRDLTPLALASTSLQGRSADGAERRLAFLPPQNVRIGRLDLHQIPFVTLASTERNAPQPEVDGLLTTGLFRRVYISYAGRFVVLEPW